MCHPISRIQINCNKCNIAERLDTILIDFNYDDVKNIIDSNYSTYIISCCHKTKDVMNLINGLHYLVPSPKYTYIVNKNYIKIYNRFEAREDKKMLQIYFNNLDGKEREVSIEEFLSLIKKGSVILFFNSTLIQKLEKVLHKHNSNFILEQLESTGVHIINTISNYTKSALKNHNY